MKPTHSQPTSIAVIVLTVNQKETTLRCLSSLAAIERPPLQIVLWDNGSHDGTTHAVEEAFPEVLVHHHPLNLGAAAGRNAAADLAISHYNPSFLLFIDNDMTVAPDCIAALMAPFADNRLVAQTTGKIKVPGDQNRLNDAGGSRVQFWLGRTFPVGHGEIDRGQYDVAKKCIPGGFSLVRTDVYREVGGFDVAFDPYGYEDLDFSLRVANQGYVALYVPDAVAFHEVTQTFEGGSYTTTYARNKARNWFLFMSRHATFLQRLGFYLVGAPYGMLRALHREARNGNLGAVRGLVGGALEQFRR